MASARKLTMAIGLGQTLAWASTYYVPATMVGAAAAEFGVSPTVLLGGFSLALLATALCAPWVGRRIDQFGGREVLSMSAVVTSVGLFALAAAPNVVAWYLAWMVIGAGMALGLYDAAFATIGRALGAQARPVIVGVTLMAGFASTLGWPLGRWLVEAHGWRVAVVVYGLLQLCVILPVYWVFVPRPGPPVVVASPVGGEVRPVHRHALAWLTAYFTLRQGITAVVSVHALTLLAGLGSDTVTVVFAASLIGPAQVGSRVLDWQFGRALNPMVAALIGAVLLPLGLGLLIGGTSAILFCVIYGVSNGILTINRGTVPLHVFGPAGYATRLGRMARPAMLASAVAPTLVSPVIGAWPAVDVVWLLAAISLAALGCLLAVRQRG